MVATRVKCEGINPMQRAGVTHDNGDSMKSKLNSKVKTGASRAGRIAARATSAAAKAGATAAALAAVHEFRKGVNAEKRKATAIKAGKAAAITAAAIGAGLLIRNRMK